MGLIDMKKFLLSGWADLLFFAWMIGIVAYQWFNEVSLLYGESEWTLLSVWIAWVLYTAVLIIVKDREP